MDQIQLDKIFGQDEHQEIANFNKYTPLAIIIYLQKNPKFSKFSNLFNFSIKHDLARSCFQLWPKIGDEGDKISRKKTGEALAETVSRNFFTLRVDFEGHNWKHDLARLCFMLYTPSYDNSQLKMEILEFTSKEAAAPLMSLTAPLWFWKFWRKKF